MLYSDSLREMMQNAVNESFWDAHGVEIGPCANFDPKPFYGGVAKKMAGLILWAVPARRFRPATRSVRPAFSLGSVVALVGSTKCVD